MIYYCCANDLNIGDHFSMLGVKDAVGLSGKEIFLERRKVPLAKELDGLSSNDVLIIGGGGIIKDYFRKYWLDILKYKKKRNYKIYIFGIGVCDHKHVSKSTVFEERLIKEIINNSKISYLRPPIPIKDHRIKETFCPSMLYIYNKYKNNNIPIKNQLLYVSHAGLVGKNIDLKIIKLLKEYCKEKGLSYFQVSNIARNKDGVESIMRKYLSSKIIVTSRLHGYIIGRSLGKKVVAISKDHKIEGFASIIGDKNPIDV
jgi:polysaccharide pyruvyl transferase WcaK-like protein